MVSLNTDKIDFPLKIFVYLYFRGNFPSQIFWLEIKRSLGFQHEQQNANWLLKNMLRENERTKTWKYLPVIHNEKNNA